MCAREDGCKGWSGWRQVGARPSRRGAKCATSLGCPPSCPCPLGCRGPKGMWRQGRGAGSVLGLCCARLLHLSAAQHCQRSGASHLVFRVCHTRFTLFAPCACCANILACVLHELGLCVEWALHVRQERFSLIRSPETCCVCGMKACSLLGYGLGCMV